MSNVTDWVSGRPETPCGRGSKFKNTELIRSIIPDVITKHEIKTIADVGCGDQNWIWSCLPDPMNYTGYDVKPRFVDVQPFDVTMQVLPEAYDLVICIFVLNHLYGEGRVQQAYRLLKESGSKLLLASFDAAYPVPFPMINETFYERRTKRKWYYGLWRMN